MTREDPRPPTEPTPESEPTRARRAAVEARLQRLRESQQRAYATAAEERRALAETRISPLRLFGFQVAG